MSWQRFVDPVFPVIEPLSPQEEAQQRQKLQDDLDLIDRANWSPNEERALDEAQRVAASEVERGRTAESKASTYLAVLAALVPVIITIQAANWEKKSGPAPEWARLLMLAIATIYTGAAGYHAFRALQVTGFHRVGEADLATVWKTRSPLRRLTRAMLTASLRSRSAINAKVTRIRATQAHLLRAFAAFVILLLLDPLFYAFGQRGAPPADRAQASSIAVDLSHWTFGGNCQPQVPPPPVAVGSPRPRNPRPPRGVRRPPAATSTCTRPSPDVDGLQPATAPTR